MAIFDIKTDFVVRYYDGTNWNPIQADTFEVEIDRGINVEEGIFARPDVGTALVRMRTKSLAPFMTAPPYVSDMDLLIEAQGNTLFTGIIQNVSMYYMPETKELEIVITANDYMKLFTNMVFTTFSITGTSSARGFRTVLGNLANAVNAIDNRVVLSQYGTASSGTTQWAYVFENKSAGEIAQTFLDAELGWLFCDKGGGLNYMTRGDVDVQQATTWNTANRTISNVHSTASTHVCMDNIDLSYNSDDLANVITVSEIYSPQTKTKTNTSSVTTYGRQDGNYQVQFDYTGVSTLQQWADAVAAAANPKSIKSVSCPAVKRDGNLSSIVTAEIGRVQQVEFAATGFTTIQEIYIISRIKHSITADHWEVTLDLWRGI
jgi:hypothetical protein